MRALFASFCGKGDADRAPIFFIDYAGDETVTNQSIDQERRRRRCYGKIICDIPHERLFMVFDIL